MIKNNNGAILRKLTLRSLKTGKMRNIFIMLTVALSVALLSGISLSVAAVQREQNLTLDTMQHVIYMEADENQIEQLRNDSRTEDMMTFKRGKAIEVENYLIIPVYYSMDAAVIESVKITEGRYPDKMNEIAVDKGYMDQIGKKAVLGETISFTWLDGTTESFTIVGFTDVGETGGVYALPFSEEYAVSGSQLKEIPFSVPLRIVGADNMSEEDFLAEIRDMGADYGIARPNINENNMFTLNMSITGTEIAVTIGIGLAVLFVSVLVIYSIFYISVTGRIRQFGQLRTLGMTSGQIKKMIHLEGIFLCLAGAPVGLLCGILFAYAVKPNGFYWQNTLIIGIIVFIADLITVLFSIRKPAKIAAGVSPLEMSKSSGYTINLKKEKTQKRNLTPFGLARISSHRNRRKSLMTAISLGVGGILFITGTTMISSWDEVKYAQQGEFRFGEYLLYFSSNAAEVNKYGYMGIQLDNPFTPEFEAKIREMDGVKDIIKQRSIAVSFEYNDYRGDDLLGSFERADMDLVNQCRDNGSEFDYDKMVENKEIIITNNNIANEIYGWEFEIGDTVKLSWYNGTEYCEDIFTIAGDVNYNKLNKSKRGLQLYINAGWFLGPEELMTGMMPEDFNFNRNLIVSVTEFKNGTEVGAELSELVEQYPEIKMAGVYEEIESGKNTLKIMQALIYGLSAFLIGFSFINLINTLVSNAISRKQDFAILRSIGMSEKQLSKMIQAEGLILAVKNVIITAIFGTAAGYLLIWGMRELGADYMYWHFPWQYLLGYTLLVIIVPIIISGVIVRVLGKKSLIEKLREME